MRYMSSIYVSDVMDQIAATIEILAWEADYGPPETVYQQTYVTPGYGDYDAVRWLQRVLDVISAGMSDPSAESKDGGAPMGGVNTISGRSDRAG
jgi:hypothetical protein